MNRILIIPKSQFGYNTDYFKMANYLSGKNVQVDVLCYDQGFRKINPLNNIINVTYIERKKNKVFNFINHYFEIFKYILKQRMKYNWIIIGGTIEFSGLIPFFLKKFTPRTIWINDIRTCAVFEKQLKRRIYDIITKLSTIFFDYVTIISDLTAEKLKIKKYTLLPLGADLIVDIKKKKLSSEEVNFLYIGVFDNRNIHRIIKAFDIFCSNLNDQIKTKFDIVGFSVTSKTQQKIFNTIENATNKDKIVFHGRKQHDEILELFQKATVGFSYVPINDYFDVQPPTKSYEYILNGIICIATNTKANAHIISKKNGVLTNDDINSVVEAMKTIYLDIPKYNPKEISNTVKENSWDHIGEQFSSFLVEIDLKSN